jgi:hypothetical protein
LCVASLRRRREWERKMRKDKVLGEKSAREKNLVEWFKRAQKQIQGSFFFDTTNLRFLMQNTRPGRGEKSAEKKTFRIKI